MPVGSSLVISREAGKPIITIHASSSLKEEAYARLAGCPSAVCSPANLDPIDLSVDDVPYYRGFYHISVGNAVLRALQLLEIRGVRRWRFVCPA